jgi:hypothetical protein
VPADEFLRRNTKGECETFQVGAVLAAIRYGDDLLPAAHVGQGLSRIEVLANVGGEYILVYDCVIVSDKEAGIGRNQVNDAR